MIWATVEVLGGISLVSGLLLGYAAIRFKVEGDPVVDQVDSLLPQAQCAKCGYPGCRQYAQAIIKGEASINLCSPGGETGMLALAHLLNQDPQPLEGGEIEKPKMVAIIDESQCIGCTKCIQACPVDAILGTTKHMHTVITQECTGCELCVAPCPVTCITMHQTPFSLATWKWPYPYSKNN